MLVLADPDDAAAGGDEPILVGVRVEMGVEAAHRVPVALVAPGEVAVRLDREGSG
jgi:hypothetical protein